MNVVGLGIDLAEIDRVRHLLGRYGERFKDRCFTDHEWAYAHRYPDPSARLAARFAGKEAVMKSLGVGWRRVPWRDIEVTGGGQPHVNLSGRAARRAEAIGVDKVLITITHTDDRAMVLARAALPCGYIIFVVLRTAFHTPLLKTMVSSGSWLASAIWWQATGLANM